MRARERERERASERERERERSQKKKDASEEMRNHEPAIIASASSGEREQTGRNEKQKISALVNVLCTVTL
jgi:hypothetical protein